MGSYKGEFDLLVLPDYLLSFFLKLSMKMKYFCHKGCSSEPPEPPLDPRLQTHQCICFGYYGEGSGEPVQCAGTLEPSLQHK